MKNKKVLGSVFVIVAAVLWGCMGIYVRNMTGGGLGSMEVVAIRVIVTALVLLAAIAIYDRKLLVVKWRDLWLFALSAMVSIVAFSYCYFTTISVTSLSVAAVLLYTSPIMVIFMSAAFFKEKLTPMKLVACAVAFIGCVLVTGVLESSSAISAVGLLFGVLSALGYALYSIFSRLLINKGYHSLTVTVYTFLFAAVGVIPFADWSKISTYLGASGTNVGLAVLMAVMTSILPYTLFTMGLQHIDPGKASIMASIEPVVATVVGFLVFSESVSFLAMCGIALVLVALVLLNLPAKGDKA